MFSSTVAVCLLLPFPVQADDSDEDVDDKTAPSSASIEEASATAGVSAAARDARSEATEETPSAVSATRTAGEDVYDEAEPDLERCRALESSLWEVAALKGHYDPEVSLYQM